MGVIRVFSNFPKHQVLQVVTLFGTILVTFSFGFFRWPPIWRNQSRSRMEEAACGLLERMNFFSTFWCFFGDHSSQHLENMGFLSPSLPWHAVGGKDKVSAIIFFRLVKSVFLVNGYIHYLPLGTQSCSQLMIGVSNHLISKVLSFHYHSQKMIEFLGFRFCTKKQPKRAHTHTHWLLMKSLANWIKNSKNLCLPKMASNKPFFHVP